MPPSAPSSRSRRCSELLGSAAVLTTIIVVYGGYSEGARQVASAVAALAAEAFDGAPDKTHGARFCRGAGALRPAGDRRLDAHDAVRQSLRRRSLYPAVAQSSAAWPDLPTSLALPWPLGVAFLACLAAAYVLPNPAAQYFSIGAGGLGGALALQGLAVAHALSRGLKMRPLMLVALYACCVLGPNTRFRFSPRLASSTAS